MPTKATKKTETKTAKSTPKAKSKSNETRRFFLGKNEDGVVELTPETYNDFDMERIVVNPPNTSSFKIGSSTITNTKTEVFVLDDEGEKALFYFYLPNCITFAPSYQYPLEDSKKEGKKGKKGKEEKKKKIDIDTRKGVQISIPLTSLASAAEPDEMELAVLSFFDRLRARGVAIGREEIKRKPVKIPKVSVSQIKASMHGDEDEDEEQAAEREVQCVKPLYTPGKEDASTGKTKPPVVYVPLLTAGKGKALRCVSKLYRDQEPFDPLEITTDKEEGVMSSRGELGEPCFILKELYWGQHGNDTPYGMSMKLNFVEADWTEVEGGQDVFIPEDRYGKGGEPEKYKAHTKDQTDFPSSDEDDGGEDDGGEDEEGTEDLEERETPPPPVKAKAKAKAKPAPKAKAAKKKPVEEELEEEPEEVEEDDGGADLEEEEEAPPPKAKAKAKAKTKAKAKPKAKPAPKEEEEENYDD